MKVDGIRKDYDNAAKKRYYAEQRQIRFSKRFSAVKVSNEDKK